jgi:hypothetical protein
LGEMGKLFGGFIWPLKDMDRRGGGEGIGYGNWSLPTLESVLLWCLLNEWLDFPPPSIHSLHLGLPSFLPPFIPSFFLSSVKSIDLNHLGGIAGTRQKPLSLLAKKMIDGILQLIGRGRGGEFI